MKVSRTVSRLQVCSREEVIIFEAIAHEEEKKVKSQSKGSRVERKKMTRPEGGLNKAKSRNVVSFHIHHHHDRE